MTSPGVRESFCSVPAVPLQILSFFEERVCSRVLGSCHEHHFPFIASLLPHFSKTTPLSASFHQITNSVTVASVQLVLPGCGQGAAFGNLVWVICVLCSPHGHCPHPLACSCVIHSTNTSSGGSGVGPLCAGQ
jgi:hypothetical protein